MDSATESTERGGSVLASYLLPHRFLVLATAADTAEVRSATKRRNRAWLLRWLPAYLQRWGVLFVACWLTTTVAAVLEFPPVLSLAFEIALYVSACMAVWLATLYVRSRMAPS